MGTIRTARLRSVLLAALAAASLTSFGPARAEPPVTATLVELFTSQGCSSCPPAEAVLGELAGKPGVLALAFHVDYWDSIGWRDTFELPVSTQRQSRYVTTLKLSSAFTPQAVIDGRVSLVGSDRRRIEESAVRTEPAIPVKLLVVNGEVVIALPDAAGDAAYDVNLVAYRSEATTAVGRGENSGRTLREFNIVRSFVRLASWQGRADTLHIPLSSLPTDADRVAVFLQRLNQGPVAGIATATL